MDLLGRKSRKLLEQVVTHAEGLEVSRNEWAEIARRQASAITELSNRLHSRESLVSDLIVEVEILKDQLAAPLALPMPGPQARPIAMTEEEQEIKFQLDNKMIDKKEYETLLEELDFQNASIELDPDFSKRPDLTY